MGKVRLGDFVTLQRGQSYSGSLVGEPGPVLLGLGTIERNGGFRSENARTYGGDCPAAILAHAGDLFVSLKDVTHAADLLGAVARVPRNISLGRLTQDTIRLDVDESVVCRDYLYWLLRSPSCRSYCKALGTGTTNLDLAPRTFLAFEFDAPSLAHQRVVAGVLGALDEKIAANATVSASTDALVRAMFDQFRASADSIRIDDLATNPRIGAKPPFGAGHYVGLEHVPRRLMWLTDTGDAEGLASGKFEFARDDVLFGKLRPYFHKVVVADRAGVCSTDILVLRPRSHALRGFMWAAAASDGVVGRVSAMSEGTRMPRTDWSSLASSEVPWPGRESAGAFSERVVTLRDRVAAGIAESARLANLRDTLLPHLMSGRITVREAEKAVEEVL